MQALYFTANGASADKAIGALPSLPVPVNYPQYNSAVLLPLQGPQYSAQVWSIPARGEADCCLPVQPSHNLKSSAERGQPWRGHFAGSVCLP